MKSENLFSSYPVRLFLTVVCVLLLGLGDMLTGAEFEFSLFYLIPIMVAAWWMGRKPAFLISILALLTLALADFIGEKTLAHPVFLGWAWFVKFVYFWIIGELSVRLKESLGRESEASRTDNLTGLPNRRGFEEEASREIRRLERYRRPFTLAVVDLDRFEEVNAHLGRSVGDRVLRSVADVLKSQLRNTDLSGRLGSDEFTVLFPETDEKRARRFIPELHRRLLSMMKKQNWPVTFSIGAVTFKHPPAGFKEMLEDPNRLMLQVKEAGRNGIVYGRY